VSAAGGGPAYSHPSEPKGHNCLQIRAMKAEHKCLQEGMLVRDTNILSMVHGAFQIICHNLLRCSPGRRVCSEGMLHIQRLQPSDTQLCVHLRRELAALGRLSSPSPLLWCHGCPEGWHRAQPSILPQIPGDFPAVAVDLGCSVVWRGFVGKALCLQISL